MAELVGLQAEVPDVLGRLGQLLQLRRLKAEAASAEQSQRQRQAIAGYDWNRHIGPDGTLDVDSFTRDPEAALTFGDQYVDYVHKASAAKAGQLEAKSKLVGLRTDQREAFAQMLNALRSDNDVAEDNDAGRRKVNDEMIRYGQLYGEDVLPVLEAYAPGFKNVPKGRLTDSLRAIGLQALSAQQQVQMQQPQYLNTGGEFEQINPLMAPPSAPASRGGGTGGGGGAGGRSSIPTTIAPDTPLRYAGQQEDIKRNQEEVSSVRTAADQAPQQRAIYKHILELSRDTNTGPFVSYLQNTKIGGQVFGDDYQELGKYLEKNAIANMQAMGAPGSDARLAAASAANGSTKFNPKALQAVTEFNYATNSALENYRRGVDKAVGTAKPDYTRLADFKSQWAQNFDVDIFRIENAEADGDKKALSDLREEILRTPGRAKELQQKRKNLDALTANGKLP